MRHPASSPAQGPHSGGPSSKIVIAILRGEAAILSRDDRANARQNGWVVLFLVGHDLRHLSLRAVDQPQTEGSDGPDPAFQIIGQT